MAAAYGRREKYPVIVSIYGGPNSGTVMDRWTAPAGKYHWAKEGVIQIAMDHRGSGHCGKKGQDMMYRNLGKWELHDYKLWIDYLRETGKINEKKVGITGYSYGGYVTALAVCTAGDYFPYGIAGAGVFDWMFYDTHYTERFMDTPQNNPEGYKNGSVLSNVLRTLQKDRLCYSLLTVRRTITCIIRTLCVWPTN